MALNHWNKQCAIAASHVNNPSIVLERVTHNQRAVDSLREALHGIVEQPGGVRACCEPGPYIGAKDVAKCMVARTNGMEMVLYTASRVGATDVLNLDACGITPDERGRLKVDPRTFQTAVPHIYCAGDAIGFPSLASTSMEQGRIAACHAFGVPAPNAPEFFPYGIFSVPEISTVGMSEHEARERCIPYECGIARFRETSRGHIMGLNAGMMKMLFSLRTRRLLGVHIVGEGATELIHIGQAVLNLKGTLDYFIENTFNYPTLAEAYKIAALDAWNRMAAT